MVTTRDGFAVPTLTLTTLKIIAYKAIYARPNLPTLKFSGNPTDKASTPTVFIGRAYHDETTDEFTTGRDGGT